MISDIDIAGGIVTTAIDIAFSHDVVKRYSTCFTKDQLKSFYLSGLGTFRDNEDGKEKLKVSEEQFERVFAIIQCHFVKIMDSEGNEIGYELFSTIKSKIHY